MDCHWSVLDHGDVEIMDMIFLQKVPLVIKDAGSKCCEFEVSVSKVLDFRLMKILAQTQWCCPWCQLKMKPDKVFILSWTNLFVSPECSEMLIDYFLQVTNILLIYITVALRM